MNKNQSVGVIRQKTQKATRALAPYRKTKAAQLSRLKPDTLRVIPLGGQDGIGEKNMIVVEYGDTALILDAGFDLSVDIPGINYAIPTIDYLETIKDKIKGYVISHGHLDHIGGLIHVVPQYPAPIYGSDFTIAMVEAQFEKRAEQSGETFTPETVVMHMDTHERLGVGEFTIELVRVTHSIPESSAIVVDTPVGRLINTGDFRLDPEPLDAKPSDIARLKALGDEGVLLLMSESTNTTKLGRTPTEHTLQESFYELVETTKGRLVVAVFSTNMNRIQMIINAAARSGRKVALDGRSMLSVAELAVRLGRLKVPKGTLVPLRETQSIPDDQLIVICTGGQGEPGAALSRMAIGEHAVIKLKKTDTVVISSTPIPGNEQSYARLGDSLARIGVKQYRHPTHEIDGSGPLHVSGHAARDEHAEMIMLTQPQYLMPIYGGPLPRRYHKEIAVGMGMHERSVPMVDNGEVLEFKAGRVPVRVGRVTSGSLLIDQTGSVVPTVVSHDRLLLQEDGFMVIVLTVGAGGRLLASPDIITRGYIATKENARQLNELRSLLRSIAAKSGALTSRARIDALKDTLQRQVHTYLFDTTGMTPLVIPVVNVVNAQGKSTLVPRPVAEVHS
jgi:ribonuclease J